MRKIFGVLLSVICLCCAAIGLTGCKKDKHTHSFDKQVITDEYKATDATCTEAATYYYSCECGEKGAETFEYGDPLGHSFTNYVSDNNATCTEDGTKTAKCDRCDKKNTVKDIDSKLHHSYTEQIVSDEYLAAPATCTEKAKYYYSCKCGEKGTETFEYGSITNHNFVNGRCTYCGKEQEASKGLEFTLLDDGTYKVSGIGSCTDTEIIIPSVYNDKPVTFIGFEAFDGCSGLTSVTIPDSVTSIGDSAFEDCSGLTIVSIGNSVTSIGEWAFYNCRGLTSVTIPNSVTFIGYYAFGNCVNLRYNEYDNAYYVGNENNPHFALMKAKNTNIDFCSINVNTKIISSNAFEDCSGLTSVTIPNSVTSIGDYAFYGCSGLTSVTIPNSVTSIGDYAFYGCSGLTSVTIPNSVTFIGYYAFGNCVNLRYNEYDNAYYVGNENNPHFALMKAKNTNIDFCSINVNTKIISSNAFEDCSGLTSVTIPNSVTSIGDYAFYGCSGLTSVTIPNSVTSISGNTFSGCSGIESLVVTTGNKKYHSANNCIIATETKKMIVGCKTSIIPSDGSVTSIGNSAFEMCSGLANIIIPDSVTSIGNSAFYGCSGLTIVSIGNSVTSIGEWAFYGCSGLTSVTIPNSVTSIGYNAFSGCSGLTSVTIPDSVTSIGHNAFSGCSGLTSVTIGNSVTSIGNGAFLDCSGLKNITYTGTIADWKNIDKGSYWNDNVSTTCVIHCTDGYIKISD